MRSLLLLTFLTVSASISAQFFPKNGTPQLAAKAEKWATEKYKSLSLDDKIGQLFIVALYTNKNEDHISGVCKLVVDEHIGGIILMQDDAAREIALVNEFQAKSAIPLIIGMDAEWGLYQRIPTAHKFPWAMVLGALQDNNLVYQMAAKIAEDCKKMGINWDFAPVVDVNTNPENPIIGNRSFGSDVENVTAKGEAYAKGLQENGILAAIKHFPGHGDTNTDSHLDLPVVPHLLPRLESTELAPFRELMNKRIGGVMVAHLYVPALETEKGVPASVSQKIVTGILKNKFNYKGLIITDALNMGAVAKRFEPGQLDLKAFEAGNDILLFSQQVADGKKLIKEAIISGKISEERLEESVKKILTTKYLLGLDHYTPVNAENIDARLNTEAHRELSEKIYANALTLLKDEKKLLPLQCSKDYYYLPLEEAPFQDFPQQLELGTSLTMITKTEIPEIPVGAVVIIGIHKDNSTAYKPYKISEESKKIISEISKNHQVILNIFGSPYALKDVDLSKISTVLVAYENNSISQKAVAKAILGETKIWGKLPVTVTKELPAGLGISLPANNYLNNTK